VIFLPISCLFWGVKNGVKSFLNYVIYSFNKILSLIHANHGNQSVINYLTDQLNKATTSAVRHGGCFGLGLAALGTRSVKIYEHLRECLYSQNEAVSGEGAGIAMGLVLAGSMNQSVNYFVKILILKIQGV